MLFCIKIYQFDIIYSLCHLSGSHVERPQTTRPINGVGTRLIICRCHLSQYLVTIMRWRYLSKYLVIRLRCKYLSQYCADDICDNSQCITVLRWSYLSKYLVTILRWRYVSQYFVTISCWTYLSKYCADDMSHNILSQCITMLHWRYLSKYLVTIFPKPTLG